MKKSLISVLALCFIFLCGCGEKNISIKVGNYVYTKSNDPLKPTLTLSDDNKFSFSYSALSSYYPQGTYIVDEDELVCITDDKEKKYVFEIEKNGLLKFDKDDSSNVSVGNFENVPDDALFELEK